MTKVRGIIFSPGIVEQVVRGVPELGDEFQVVVTRENDYDRILTVVEVLNHHAHRRDEIARSLLRDLRNGTQLRCEVEIREFGTLPRYEMKSKRFMDLRTKH